MKLAILALSSFLFAVNVTAKDESLEVDATRIKADKELPKVLYVVPWKDMESTKNADQKLVVHDFLGDLYDPVLASSTAHATKSQPTPIEASVK
jgi:hypothetical protein